MTTPFIIRLCFFAETAGFGCDLLIERADVSSDHFGQIGERYRPSCVKVVKPLLKLPATFLNLSLRSALRPRSPLACTGRILSDPCFVDRLR